MSILLSAYFPEGIVFAADRNVTIIHYTNDNDAEYDVEPNEMTKVIPWPEQRAVVGFCGLGRLAGITMGEWMRQFVAQTRRFSDIETLAMQMRDQVQRDFDSDYPEGECVDTNHLIIHLGGYRFESDIAIPVMYLISNVPGHDNGVYRRAVRNFHEPVDHIPNLAQQDGYNNPLEYRTWLQNITQHRHFVWFANGLFFPAFNVLKDTLWGALTLIRERDFMPLPHSLTLEDRTAYCAMAVDLFGSLFRHHLLPRYRMVGGFNTECVPWPEE